MISQNNTIDANDFQNSRNNETMRSPHATIDYRDINAVNKSIVSILKPDSPKLKSFHLPQILDRYKTNQVMTESFPNQFSERIFDTNRSKLQKN